MVAKSVASWDEKRAVCGNCKHIFLKAQSRIAGYCSVDCHANATYLDTVQQRIRAMRLAANEPTPAEPVVAAAPVTVDGSNSTFADFYTAKLSPGHAVEWSFSAMY